MKKSKLFMAVAMSVTLGALSAQAAELTVNTPIAEGSVIKYSGILTDGVTDYVGFYVKGAESSDTYYYIGKTIADSVTGEFSGTFNMSDTAPSGDYEIVFAGTKMGESKSGTFTFYSKAERDTLISNLTDTGKSVTEIISLITDETNTKILKAMNCNVESFIALGANQTSAAEILKSKQNGYYTSPLTEENFKNMFNYAVVFTATVKSSDITESLKQYADSFGIDASDLEKNEFIEKKIKEATVGSPEDFVKVYNGARAVASINDELDYKNVKTVLEKYASVYGLDMTNYQSLSEYQMTAVYQDIISRDYETPEAVADAFKAKYKSLLGSGSGSSGGGGGGSSSGGSSGGSVTSTGGGTGYIPSMDSNDLFYGNQNQTTTVKKFNDIANYAWAEEAINTLSENNVIDGISDNQFAPSANVKREEFVKMIVSAFTLANADAACDFDDVNDNAWYYMYIASAVNKGVVSGRDNNMFGTGENITREDMAVILHRALKKSSTSLSSGKTVEFTDNDSVSDYALESVTALSSSGIISGREDGSFGPKDNATRAEAARLIYEAWKQKY